MRDGTAAWLPAYHCGVEVEAVIAAGFRPRFYDLGDDLAPDPAALDAGLARDPGPVLLVHYFGRVQPRTTLLAEVARRHGQLLVEDTSHLLPAAGAGGGGPVRAGSLRKVLGTVDGGLLRVDRAAARDVLGRELAPPPPLRAAVWPWLVLARRKLHLPIGDFEPTGDAASGGPSLRSYRRAVSAPSRRVVVATDPAAIARRRRAARSALRVALRDVLPPSAVAAEPGDHDVPLCLVVRVEGRDRLVDALRRDGVDPYVFGRRPHPALPDGFPGAARLRSSLLGLPAHHALEAPDVERLARVVRRHLPAHIPAAALGSG